MRKEIKKMLSSSLPLISIFLSTLFCANLIALHNEGKWSYGTQDESTLDDEDAPFINTPLGPESPPTLLGEVCKADAESRKAAVEKFVDSVTIDSSSEKIAIFLLVFRAPANRQR